MGIPLDSLKIPQSKWEYSEVLRDGLTALAWGIGIEDFWEMPAKKRAYMIGVVAVKSQMTAYEGVVQEERMRQEQNKAQN